MFWNKNITGAEYWFVGLFLLVYFIYIIKILYLSAKLKTSARAIFLKLLPRLVAFVLIVMALMEPTFGIAEFENKESKIGAKKILQIIDISRSMEAADIAPTRLQKAKSIAVNLIQENLDNEYALVSFASNAYLNNTFTFDDKYIINQIKNLQTEQKGRAGTNLNEALKIGLQSFSRTNALQNNVSIIIIYTDGEDFSDLESEIFDNLNRNRVKLIIIGVGTTDGAPIYDARGIPLKNANNQAVISKLEKEYLTSIAENTNGLFMLANQQNDIGAELNNYVKNYRFTNNFISNGINLANKYHYALIIAFFIIAFDLIFSIRIFNF